MNKLQFLLKPELGYVVGLISLIFAGVSMMIGLAYRYQLLWAPEIVSVCYQVIYSLTQTSFYKTGIFVVFLILGLMLIGTFKLLISYLKTRLLISRYLRAQVKISKKVRNIIKKNAIPLKLVAVVYSQEDVALTVGLFQPKIILSNNLVSKLTSKQLEAVMLHEYYHAKSFHGLLVILSELVENVFFFFPIVKTLLSVMRVKLERLADQFVQDFQGTNVFVQRALVKLRYDQPLAHVSYFFGVVRLSDQVRFSSLRPKQNVSHLVVSLVSVLVLLGLLIIPENVSATHLALVEADQLYCQGRLQSVVVSYEQPVVGEFSGVDKKACDNFSLVSQSCSR